MLAIPCHDDPGPGAPDGSEDRIQGDHYREAQEKLQAFLLHDLKNPIATILLQAEPRLELEPDSAPRAQTLADAEHLLKLVASWMDHIWAQAQGVQPDLAPVAIRPFLEEILARHGLWLKVRDLRGQIEMEDDQLVHALDAVLMGRVLGNLLDNSLRFSPQGGALTLCAARTSAGGLRLEVLDQGPGVPPELRERLFDPYFRLERPGSGRSGTPICSGPGRTRPQPWREGRPWRTRALSTRPACSRPPDP